MLGYVADEKRKHINLQQNNQKAKDAETSQDSK